MSTPASRANDPAAPGIPGPAAPPTQPAVPPDVEEPDSRRPRRWLGSARNIRTRILISYVLILAVSAVISIFALRESLGIRLDDQVDDALQQEILELDRLLVDGRDPATGLPFASLEALFDIYFARNVPSEEEAMLAYVDGEPYRSTLARFPLDRLPSEVSAEWRALSSSSLGAAHRAEGSFNTDLGEARYRATRLVFRGDTGSFVVTILPQAERAEIRELQAYGIAATLGLLVVASALAWLIAGRILAPVQNLTETAHAISESDLTQRVDVRGRGDAADMARSFNGMLDRLETLFRSQRAFVQDASHELRDPLTICRGHLELLGPDPEEQRQTVALVMDELDRMGRIVDDLSLLAEVEQPDFIRPDWTDLGPFTSDLYAKCRALASRNWALEATGEGSFFGDRHRLTEAVMNLAHNAVQHTVPDETVAIGTSAGDGEVRIWVRDTGTGITVADQELVFERFKRGTGAHRRYRGGGLGLAIVKAIAEAHGGRVELDSRLGVGSTFTIVVPQERTERGGDGPNPDR